MPFGARIPPRATAERETSRSSGIPAMLAIEWRATADHS
jgi:hypothetical protein